MTKSFMPNFNCICNASFSNKFSITLKPSITISCYYVWSNKACDLYSAN